MTQSYRVTATFDHMSVLLCVFLWVCVSVFGLPSGNRKEWQWSNISSVSAFLTMTTWCNKFSISMTQPAGPSRPAGASYRNFTKGHISNCQIWQIWYYKAFVAILPDTLIVKQRKNYNFCFIADRTFWKNHCFSFQAFKRLFRFITTFVLFFSFSHHCSLPSGVYRARSTSSQTIIHVLNKHPTAPNLQHAEEKTKVKCAHALQNIDLDDLAKTVGLLSICRTLMLW